MDPALTAYRTLIELARADGRLAKGEVKLLERYRRALGLSRQLADEAARVEPPATAPAASTPQGLTVVRMMIRVALADGRFVPRERARLEHVARQLGIDRVQYAGLFVAVESQLAAARRMRRALLAVAGVAVLGLVVVGVVLVSRIPRDASTGEQLGRLRAELDELTYERAARDEALVRASRQRGPLAAFKQAETRYGPSVLLIVVVYDMVREASVATQWSTGTGFFVTPDGLIVTNKHVAQPWKFNADAARLVEQGFRLDEESVNMAAWPAGARLITEEGAFDLDSAYANKRDSLRLYRAAEDRFEMRPGVLASGEIWFGNLHEMGTGDLVVLEATIAEPVRPFPLPRSLPGIEKLDPVMVMGFPQGIAILERRRAETSAALGQVSKIEESILITAPVVPGNSGGPVVDVDGRVIGVATLSPGGGLGICLQTERFLPLLPAAAELAEGARRHAEGGRDAAARSLLDLAELREPSAAEQAELDRIRAGLERL